MNRVNCIAPGLNAFTFSFNADILEELRNSFQQYIFPAIKQLHNGNILSGIETGNGTFGSDIQNYYYTNEFLSTLLWISCNNWETYAQFKKFFDRLNITDFVKSQIDYQDKIELYCGFILISDRSDEELWHVDYYHGANAFTLICPLFSMDKSHGGLLYLDQEGEKNLYHYQPGEAIIFGEGFEHTTQPFAHTNAWRVLVSLTFGTDKLRYWPVLQQTIADYQSQFFVMPCGHQYKTCDCFERFSLREIDNQALNWAAHYFPHKKIKVLKNHPWSKTLQLIDDKKNYAYIKILPQSRQHEPKVTALLSQYFPDYLPTVLAHHHEKGWLLMANHQGRRHYASSVAQAYKRLVILAKMQAQCTQLTDLMSCLPPYDITLALEDLLHCLCPERMPSSHHLPLKTPASTFILASEADHYFEALKNHSISIMNLLHQASSLPVTLEHGDFQYDNAAEQSDGQTILYDWGDVCAAPIGLSLSNPLFFDSPSRAIRACESLKSNKFHEQNNHHLADTSVSFDELENLIGADHIYSNLIAAYIHQLVTHGYAERDKILVGLPGGILAGAMRWLVSWSLEENYQEELSSVAGDWWRTTLNDIVQYLNTEKP